jgi:hypothetical protein
VVGSIDGYASHRPSSRDRTGTAIDFQTESSLLSLPPSSFPTEALERRRRFTLIPSHGIDLLPPPIPSPTFEHFLSTQPEWSQRLLPTLVHDISIGEIFQLFSCPFNDCSLRWFSPISTGNVRMGACHEEPPSHSCQMQWSNIWRLYRLLSCRGPWPSISHDFFTSFGNILQEPTTPHRHLV